MGDRTARYLVAKYLPDLQRMEARNIGVIVWSPEGIAARFIAEREPGEIDGRAVPGYVRSANACKQWVAYWRGSLSVASWETSAGNTVARDSPGFLDALKATSKGQYCLVDGGFLLDRIPADELDTLADTLYRKLVAPEDATPRLTLESQLELALESAKLKRSPHLIRRYAVPYRPSGGREQNLVFALAFKNGTLQRLYERISLHPKQREKNVQATAWKFEKVLEAEIVSRDKTAALVFLPDEQRDEPGVEQALDVLHSVTRVINVADKRAALDEFAPLPALAEH